MNTNFLIESLCLAQRFLNTMNINTTPLLTGLGLFQSFLNITSLILNMMNIITTLLLACLRLSQRLLKTTPILLNMMNMNTTPLPVRLYLSKSKLENVVNLQYLKSSVLEITEPARILS